MCRTFEKQMRLKAHYVIHPEHLWASIAHMARTQDGDLLNTLQEGFKYIENESFQSTFSGFVLGNRSRLRQARQDLRRPECEALHNHHQDSRGPRGVLH